LGEVEIRVTREELRVIKDKKREIEKRFRDIGGLKRTLAYLKYSLLLEHRNRLKTRLEELEKKHLELVEFEEKARRDKEILMKIRRELSEENAKLRKMLEAKK